MTKRSKLSWVGMFIVPFLIFHSSLEAQETKIASLRVDWPTGPLVDVEVSPIPASENRLNYDAISGRLELRDNEVISIIHVEFINRSGVDMTTKLGEIVAVTGDLRRVFRAYLHENPATGNQMYQVPDWKLPLTIPANDNKVGLRLVFLIESGTSGAFERSLNIHVCFSHGELDGLYHTIAIGKSDSKKVLTIETTSERKPDKYSGGEVTRSSDFVLSDGFTAEKARSLVLPSDPRTPKGPSAFIEKLLGLKGNDDFPWWYGVSKAIERAKFDYYVAMRFVDTLNGYLERYPSGLARTSIWTEDIRSILAVTEHRIYWASEGYGILSLPHNVSECLLYVASESLSYGLTPSDLAPKPGAYTVSHSSEPEYIVECRGCSVKVRGKGGDYTIEVTTIDGKVIPMLYNRY